MVVNLTMQWAIWLLGQEDKKLDCFCDGKSAASYCCQVAALVPDMFCYFCVVKNHKIVNNSATTEAREKIRTYLESLDF
jgi:hypothetical protein